MKLQLTKNINDEIFWNYFQQQNLLFLAKDLITAMRTKNKQLVNNVKDKFIEAINRKQIPENENPEMQAILLKYT